MQHDVMTVGSVLQTYKEGECVCVPKHVHTACMCVHVPPKLPEVAQPAHTSLLQGTTFPVTGETARQ